MNGSGLASSTQACIHIVCCLGSFGLTGYLRHTCPSFPCFKKVKEFSLTSGIVNEAFQPRMRCQSLWSNLTNNRGTTGTPNLTQAVRQGSDTSMTDDFRVFHDSLTLTTETLGIERIVIQEKSHMLFDIMNTVTLTNIALSINNDVLKLVEGLWQTFFHFQTGGKKNQIPHQGFEHFYTHPDPGSIMVWAVQEKSRSTKGTLMDKNTKKLDLFGHKAYSFTSLQLHIVNSQALFEKYSFLNGWE